MIPFRLVHMFIESFNLQAFSAAKCKYIQMDSFYQIVTYFWAWIRYAYPILRFLLLCINVLAVLENLRQGASSITLITSVFCISMEGLSIAK